MKKMLPRRRWNIQICYSTCDTYDSPFPLIIIKSCSSIQNITIFIRMLPKRGNLIQTRYTLLDLHIKKQLGYPVFLYFNRIRTVSKAYTIQCCLIIEYMKIKTWTLLGRNNIVTTFGDVFRTHKFIYSIL